MPHTWEPGSPTPEVALQRLVDGNRRFREATATTAVAGVIDHLPKARLGQERWIQDIPIRILLRKADGSRGWLERRPDR